MYLEITKKLCHYSNKHDKNLFADVLSRKIMFMYLYSMFMYMYIYIVFYIYSFIIYCTLKPVKNGSWSSFEQLDSWRWASALSKWFSLQLNVKFQYSYKRYNYFNSPRIHYYNCVIAVPSSCVSITTYLLKVTGKLLLDHLGSVAVAGDLKQ